MEKPKERLLIPQDFSEPNLSLVAPNIVAGSVSLPKENVCLINRSLSSSSLDDDQKTSMELNFLNLKLKEEESFLNPLFNCLNPRNYFSHCFNKEEMNSVQCYEDFSAFQSSSSIPVTNMNTDIINISKSPFLRSSSSNSLSSEGCQMLSRDDLNTAQMEMPASTPECGSTHNSDDNLRTPDSFLTTSQIPNKASFANVPDIVHEATCMAFPSDFTDVQNSSEYDKVLVPLDNRELFSLSKPKEKTEYERKYYSDSKTYIRKDAMLTPDSFLISSSVRRKLEFACPNPHIVKKGSFEREERDFPKFQCSLEIPENIYKNISSADREKENSTSSFHKNPFPPIGVFWDIENCRVPKGLSATHVVQAIRNRFFEGYKEAEFICVCDTLKEHPKVLEELNDAQVNIMHVGSLVKNAADDKLLQSMRRFADIHGAGASLILISGDSDFATELYDLRYRKKLRVILVHNAHTQDSLKMSAHETVLFSDVTQELPQRILKSKGCSLSREVIVWNLPLFVDSALIKKRLHFISSNCGGKGISVQRNFAKVTFNTPELAARAKKRIDGEDVYGNRVNCTFGKNDRESSYKCRQTDANFGTRSSTSVRDYIRDPLKKEDFIPPLPFRRFSREEATADSSRNCGKALWNRPFGSTGNMYESCDAGWRDSSPVANGRNSFTSSPGPNLSSQSSSREPSPEEQSRATVDSPVFIEKTDSQSFPYESILSSQSANNGYQPQPLNAPHLRDIPWLENASDSWNSKPDQALQWSVSAYADTMDEEEYDSIINSKFFKDEFWLKIRKLLWDTPNCSLPLNTFVDLYRRTYGRSPDIDLIKRDLSDYVQIQNKNDRFVIEAVPAQIFARNVIVLLSEAGGRMLLINLAAAYNNRFGLSCRPSDFGFPGFTSLLMSFGDLTTIRGKRSKRIIVLNYDQIPDLPAWCPPFRIQNVESREGNFRSIASSYNRVPSPPSPPPPFQNHISDKESRDSIMNVEAVVQPPYQESLPVSSLNGDDVTSQLYDDDTSWSVFDTDDAVRSVLSNEGIGKAEEPPNPCQLPSPKLFCRV